MNAIKIAILEKFAQVKDPRKHHSPPHSLLEIITLTLCAVIDGAADWVAVEQFGWANETWLRRFLRLPNGIPSHDTLGNVFAAIAPAGFEAAFCHWTQTVSHLSRGQIEPFDAQTFPRSPDGRLGKQAIRMIRAWANQNPAVEDYLKLDTPTEPTPVPASSDPLESMRDPILPEIQDCPTGANLPTWNDWRGNWFGFEHQGWPPIFSGEPDRYDRFAPYPIQPFHDRAAHTWPSPPQTGPALPSFASIEAHPRPGEMYTTQSNLDLSGLFTSAQPFTQVHQTPGQIKIALTPLPGKLEQNLQNGRIKILSFRTFCSLVPNCVTPIKNKGQMALASKVWTDSPSFRQMHNVQNLYFSVSWTSLYVSGKPSRHRTSGPTACKPIGLKPV